MSLSFRRPFRLRPARPGPLTLTFERFEPRVLLAGDVSVFLDAGRLFVVGDDAANLVQIVGTPDGAAEVVGLEGTTVNGGAAAFQSGPGLSGLVARMNGGADEASLQGLVLSGNLTFQGHAGQDVLEIVNSAVGSFIAETGAGGDVVDLDNLFVSGSAGIETAAGEDVVTIGALAVGRYLHLFTGDGSDMVAARQISSGRLTALATGGGDDQVLLAGAASLGQGSGVRLGSGDDFLGILPRQTGGQANLNNFFSVDGGSGDELFALDADVRAGNSSMFSGRSGQDRFEPGGAATGHLILGGFQPGSGQNVGHMLDHLFEDLAESGVDPARFGGPALVFDLTLTTSVSFQQFVEDGGAVAVDSSLELTGPSDSAITSASVAIDGFPDPLDVLEFDNTVAISGTFDTATGVLSLSGTGDLAAWQQALRSVRFNNSSQSPSLTDRSVVFVVNSADDTASASRPIGILNSPDAPILGVTSETREFDIDDDQLQRPLPVDPEITVTDIDTTQFNAANISISIAAGLQPGDQLAVTAPDGVTAEYSGQNGVLSLVGSLDIGALQEMLRSLAFDSSADRPPLGERIVNLSVSDGALSDVRNVMVNVTASGSVLVEVADSLLSFTEFDDPLVVDSELTVEPGPTASSDLVSGATVQIVTGYVAGQDVLELDLPAGVTGNFDAVTGTLSLVPTAAEGTAPASLFQTALRSVRYANAATGNDLSIGDRTIEFSVTSNGTTSSDSRVLRVSPASQQRLIENYLAENNLTSEQTPSGLHYIVEQEGDGNFPTIFDNVTVNYSGFLLDGESFDSGEDVTFPLSGVIAGWQEGIPMFSVGGSGQLIIPSDLAYGENGVPGSIPPNAILVFEVDLLAIEPNLAILDVCLSDHSEVVAHDHAELRILIDGAPVVIGEDIGIDDAVCNPGLRGVHTHDDSGTLHIETPSVMDAPVGAFFHVWGETFNKNQILGNMANANKEVVMFVNGELNDQFERYLMQDGDVIEIQYRDR